MADKKTETKKVSKTTTTKKTPAKSVKTEIKDSKIATKVAKDVATKAKTKTTTEKKSQPKEKVKTTKTAKKPTTELKQVSKPQELKPKPKQTLISKTKSLISKPKPKPKSSKEIEVKETEVEEKVKVKKSKEIKKVEFNVKLPSKLYSSEKIYEQAIFDTILSDRASRRQGTHQVKNRAQVSGSGKKPWRQKGTGRARTGSLRTPIFVGGGRAFGPRSAKNYTLKVNKKVRKAAFLSALTMLAKSRAIAIDDLKLEQISTKNLVEKLIQLQVNNLRRILIVTEDTIVYKSASNISNVATIKANSLSVELLLAADVMIISNESLKLLEGKYK